ncbi:hypothetical protein [Lactobacillus sp. PV034]|uniref:hypothetical protein n=1 Tax=Lactobacillus sp. PV034 TaxID=2594495 RepID=UPI00223ED6D3|nr:hypothetical protein [Lactobacillus sp. PV034]QNQ81277.1 ABC transporter ATP-binding protein [Lactobacillus sp. PV034]
MKKAKYFPVIYAILSAIISFLAVLIICQRFHLQLSRAVIVSGLFAVFFYIISYFRGHASFEIKRITKQYHLSADDLAKITGMKSSDFPIVKGQLQLILPKRKWPQLLEKLQNFEQKKIKNHKDKEEKE